MIRTVGVLLKAVCDVQHAVLNDVCSVQCAVLNDLVSNVGLSGRVELYWSPSNELTVGDD